jgi:hypothetical protein
VMMPEQLARPIRSSRSPGDRQRSVPLARGRARAGQPRRIRKIRSLRAARQPRATPRAAIVCWSIVSSGR